MPTESGFDLGLLSPVSAGADRSVSDAAVLRAILTAEVGYVQALARLGVAPEPACATVALAADELDLDEGEIALEAVADGNPVIPVVTRLRAALAGHPDAAALVHRGLTSQDVLDTALALVAATAIPATVADLDRVVAALAALARRYRDTPAAARTITQHAVPTTVGARFADWLLQVDDARSALAAAVPPAQLGGAAGTLAAVVELYGAEVAGDLPAALAEQLGLPAPGAPWHVRRGSVTRLGDGLVTVTDALGRIALDVATLSRTEIAELAEGSGGGSSTMPQKRNPVRSALIRSAALRAPALASTLHVAAASAVDERPDGAWHAEWPVVRELLRLARGAAALAADLAEGLTVDEGAVARNLALTGAAITAERAALGSADADPAAYLGLAASLVDRAIARAAR